MSPLFNPSGSAIDDFVHIGGASGLTNYKVAHQANEAALGTGAPTANVLRAMPFIAPDRGGALDTLAYEITSSVAGNTRIGLYRNTSKGNLYPAELLDDSGSIANSNAFKTFAVTRALIPGEMYWLAIVSNVASTMRALGLTSVGTLLGNGGSGGAVNAGISVAHAYAALPNPFTAGGAYITAVPIPALLYKFSS